MTTKTTRWTPFILEPDRCVLGDMEPPRCPTCNGNGRLEVLEHCPTCKKGGSGYTVLLGCDVFTKWDQELRDHQDNILHRCPAGHWVYWDSIRANGIECGECESLSKNLARLFTFDDLRQSIFQTIDARPETRFVLPTRHLERVRELMGDHVHVDVFLPHPRPNVTIAAIIDNQQDADTMLPKLAELRELCGGLGVVYTGREPLGRDAFWKWGDELRIVGGRWCVKCHVHHGLSHDEQCPNAYRRVSVIDTLILDPASCSSKEIEAARDKWQGTDEDFSDEISLWYESIEANIESAHSAASEAGIEVIDVTLDTKGGE